MRPNKRLKPTLRVGAGLGCRLFLFVHQYFSQGGLGFPLGGLPFPGYLDNRARSFPPVIHEGARFFGKLIIRVLIYHCLQSNR